jgi:hypothetical protein
MSLSAALVLAAAAAAPVQHAAPSHGVVLAQARATAQILPAAIVRQASGLQQATGDAPRHQLSRHGNTVLIEFE